MKLYEINNTSPWNHHDMPWDSTKNLGAFSRYTCSTRSDPKSQTVLMALDLAHRPLEIQKNHDIMINSG